MNGRFALPNPFRRANRYLPPRRSARFAKSASIGLFVAAILVVAPMQARAQLPEFDANSDTPPVMLVADELEYDQDNQIISARGNVEVVQNGEIVLADEITGLSSGKSRRRRGQYRHRPA